MTAEEWGYPMRSSDSGKGRGKLIVTLVIVGAMFYAAAKAIPIYVHAYEFQDFLRDQVSDAMSLAHRRPTVEEVRNNILSKASELQLPVQAKDVSIELSQSRVSINIDYQAPVDLGVYTLNLHFTPSADNRSLY